MNVSDSDIVRSIMLENGYDEAETANDAGVVMLNTCAIREKAEGKVISRLEALKHARRQTKTHKADTVAVLGCMASRLKERLLEQGGDLAHVVAGPDSYRDLPGLLETVRSGESQSAMSVALSLNETYADITPARQASMGKRSAFVSIMRGCNNMCSFCVVPLTRGRERCRTIDSIVHEVEQLRDGGFREVVLLGQNVNSYFEGMGKPKSQRLAAPGGGSDHHQQEYKAATGFKNMYRLRDGHGARFADLLRAVAQVDPELRIRFTSPHPKDFPDEVLYTIREFPNIARGIHMPMQSGSDAVLRSMRRGCTRDAFYDLTERMREIVPDCELSTDIISGFCGETEDDHQDTLDMIRRCNFEAAFMFAYSMRERLMHGTSSRMMLTRRQRCTDCER